ncbi:MAG: BLUF domain-containing protein [Pseudomonadota bacterium]
MPKAGSADISDLFQIIYASQPFGYDTAMLSGILLDARNCNSRDGVTGALICRHDIYLQLLEGPEAKVKATSDRISRDDRHIGMKTLVSKRVPERVFGDWAMLHDPAKTWIWTEKEIADGIIDRVTLKDLTEVFESLAEKAKD